MEKKSAEKANRIEPRSWTRFLGDDLKRIFIFAICAIAVCVGLVVLAMFSAPTGGGGTFRPHGRIVITSDSKSPDGIVSATFERCRYFVIYDLASRKFSAMANPFFKEMHPGAQAAQLVANKNEEAVITGNIGAAAFQTLENFNIQVYLVPKISVRGAVRRFLDGSLVHINTANQIGMINAVGGFPQQPGEREGAAMQGAAWNTPAFHSPITSPRMAYCPRCGLQMALGSHIQTNRVMCPYCPGQSMKIMMPGGGQAQAAGFIPGGSPMGGMTTRGVVTLR